MYPCIFSVDIQFLIKWGLGKHGKSKCTGIVKTWGGSTIFSSGRPIVHVIAWYIFRHDYYYSDRDF